MHRKLDGDQVMQPTTQQIRLITSLSMQRDEATLHRPSAESFFNDTDPVVWDEADPRKQEDDNDDS